MLDHLHGVADGMGPVAQAVTVQALCAWLQRRWNLSSAMSGIIIGTKNGLTRRALLEQDPALGLRVWMPPMPDPMQARRSIGANAPGLRPASSMAMRCAASANCDEPIRGDGRPSGPYSLPVENSFTFCCNLRGKRCGVEVGDADPAPPGEQPLPQGVDARRRAG